MTMNSILPMTVTPWPESELTGFAEDGTYLGFVRHHPNGNWMCYSKGVYPNAGVRKVSKGRAESFLRSLGATIICDGRDNREDERETA